MDHWRDARHAFVADVADRQVTLKILLKTCDDDEHLEPWIEHHGGMVGYENLVIFDHGSTSSVVLDVYARYRDRVTLVGYTAFVDEPHRIGAMPELYAWLARTCCFHVFLDTDERLALFEDGAAVTDRRVLDHLDAVGDAHSLPGVWLFNHPGSDRLFAAGSRGALVSGLVWGKPVVSTRSPLPRIALHNNQMAAAFAVQPIRLFVLHLNKLTLGQRARSIVRQLRLKGVAIELGRPEAIVDVPAAALVDQQARAYAAELAALLQAGPFLPPPAGPKDGHVLIREDGSLAFGPHDDGSVLTDLRERPAEVMHQAWPALF